LAVVHTIGKVSVANMKFEGAVDKFSTIVSQCIQIDLSFCVVTPVTPFCDRHLTCKLSHLTTYFLITNLHFYSM